MMDIERQRTLKSRHPDILGKVGIECGTGWWDLIDVLCHQLEEQAEHEGLAPPRALQVKQKFGGLRFYTDRSNDLYFALIKMAEAMSFRLCEDCGHPGVPRPGSGVFTLCQACFDQFRKNDPMWHNIDN
jgi:hypothetical protein